VNVLEPYALVAVSVALYIPAEEYVTAGFCNVEVGGVAPGKFHDHEVGVLVDKSKYETVCPVQTVVGVA
jgi:hypothetical protein